MWRIKPKQFSCVHRMFWKTTLLSPAGFKLMYIEHVCCHYNYSGGI